MPSVRITYVGHATTLIEGGGRRILTDPVLRERILHIRRQTDAPAKEAYGELDAVLLSHLHADHFDPRSLRMLGDDVRIVAPAGAGPTLAYRGFSSVTELGMGEEVELGEVRLRAVPAEHDGRRMPFGRPIDAIGFVIEVQGRRIYFAGDTGVLDDVRRAIGPVDVALIPIAGWGPSLPPADHLNPHTAAEAVAALSPKIAIPIHWGTLARIGLKVDAETLRKPATDFAAHLARLAPGVELRTLAPGESTELNG